MEKQGLNDSRIASISFYPHFHELAPQNIGWHYRGNGCCFGPGVQCVYVFQYVMSGKGVYTVGGMTYSLQANDLFLIRPGEVTFYQADQEDPYMYEWISFCGDMTEEFLARAGFSNSVYVQHVPELRSMYIKLQKIVQEGETTELQICAMLYELLHILELRNNCSHLLRESMPEKHARSAREYIEANFNRDISIQGIADVIGVDRRYLSSVFTKYIGISPQKYLVEYRLKQATKLLDGQKLSVTEVANSVGYNDVLLFSKMYKKRYGVSPTKRRC